VRSSISLPGVFGWEIGSNGREDSVDHDEFSKDSSQLKEQLDGHWTGRKMGSRSEMIWSDSCLLFLIDSISFSCEIVRLSPIK
jgi:hypothetical protein